MYYDLIASLPHLPRFDHAERLPITPLRLEQRLRRLRLEHAEQLSRTRPLVRWRPERLTEQTDVALAAAYQRVMDSRLDEPLREYVAFLMTQQTLLAALRRKQAGLAPPVDSSRWGVGPRKHHIRTHWDAPYFGLKHVYPWWPEAWEHLAAGDAMALERLLLDLNWQGLTRAAEQSMFGFQAVVAFVLKWDMLRAWLQCDAVRAKIRFTALVDKVTHVENT
jgi:hypothetical protein